MENDGSMGAKFWLGFMGVILAGAIAPALLFIFFGAVWYAWGFFGVLLFITVVGLGFGWPSTAARRNDAANSPPSETSAARRGHAAAREARRKLTRSSHASVRAVRGMLGSWTSSRAWRRSSSSSFPAIVPPTSS